MFMDWSGWLSNPVMWPFLAFHFWMLVDAARRQEWVWFAFIFVFPIINDILYFFLVFRADRSSVSTGFELPGQHKRERIAARLSPMARHQAFPHIYAKPLPRIDNTAEFKAA